jgi:hypothetical protein
MITAPTIQETLASQQDLIVALERENKILREELALLRQHIFGRRSERIEPGQLGLYGSAGLEQAAERAAATVSARRERAEAPKGHGREAFPAHLPREVVTCTVPEERRACPECGKAMTRIGTEGGIRRTGAGRRRRQDLVQQMPGLPRDRRRRQEQGRPGAERARRPQVRHRRGL